MSQILEFCSLSSQVIPYEELQYHMKNDIENKNEYYMNQNMVDRYFKSIGLTLDSSYHIFDYQRLEVYGRTIHMIKEFPDDEVIIVNKYHPHWYRI